ncbi:type II toxin-antitoxin system RelE/ParE family toxin [Methylomonas lenta]|uniref:type II toxin-antitoxin system RelE/ParE family toxin n=1 Tax=Methylomonas lenta TaxID=980561 RepID=UPI001E35CEA3|nr:type II toxin-antitoxin system RelE/ParE family toxin [Methylomonas lenta]
MRHDPHLCPRGYRQLRINRHVVFYRVTVTKIHIVRILHDSMNSVEPNGCGDIYSIMGGNL